MLRATFARKVIRLRSARVRIAQRSVHGYESSESLPILTDLPPTPEPTRPFPLYQRPPEPQYIPLNQETLDSLPSSSKLSKELKVRLTKKAVENLPELQEEDIKRFYKDLVLTGLEDAGHEKLALEAPEELKRLPFPAEERKDILRELEDRLLAPLHRHQRIGVPTTQEEGIENRVGQVVKSETEGKRIPRHVRLLEELAELAVIDQGPSGTSKSPASQTMQPARMDIPLGVVSSREWKALFEEFLARKDARGAESLLDVMHLHGVAVDEDRISSVMRTDAEAGRVEDVGRLMLELSQSGLPITDSHKDLLILSLLRKTPSEPRAAINQLLSAEAAGQPYPQSSYHVAITHLTKPSSFLQPDAQTRAMAWDLFTQMRFAAHPTPSREMYNTMIRTCGEATQPQPERARDLWLEMTESDKIQPTRDEYTSLIRALGSTKKDYLEAFDLLRQMLAKHHDATFVPFAEEDGEGGSTSLPRFSAYVPSLETFTALLEGTKRAGDLNRARWILTESVKLARTGQMLGSKDWMKGVDEDVLSGVFMTYAAWKPVIGRHAVKLKEGAQVSATDQNTSPSSGEPVTSTETKDGGSAGSGQANEWLDIDVLEELVEPPVENAGVQSRTESTEHIESTESQQESERPVVPVSSTDALREADALFQRILHDIRQVRTSTSDVQHSEEVYLPFKNVRLTPRLVNSYISVHLAHSPSLESAKQKYDETWSTVSEISGGIVRPNGWTYLHVLEKCSMGNRGGVSAGDRAISLAWGQEIWESYLTWSESATETLATIIDPSARARQTWLAGLGERQIERIWRANIRLQAVHGSVDRSLSLLEDFAARYPSTEITRTYAPLPNMGFKVKMSTAATIPEVAVPPYLTFKDVDVLHARLVKTGGPENGWNADGLMKVKTIIRGYEGRLKERRRWRMRGWQRGRDTRGQMAETEVLESGQVGPAKTQTRQLLEQSRAYNEAEEEVEEEQEYWEEHIESQTSRV